MNDQPNLRQFLDEVSSFSDDDSAAAAPLRQPHRPLEPIGKVLEIAGSGSQICPGYRTAACAPEHTAIPRSRCRARSAARSR